MKKKLFNHHNFFLDGDRFQLSNLTDIYYHKQYVLKLHWSLCSSIHFSSQQCIVQKPLHCVFPTWVRVSMSSSRSFHISFRCSFHSAMRTASPWPCSIMASHASDTWFTLSWPTSVVSLVKTLNLSSNIWKHKHTNLDGREEVISNYSILK